MPIGRGGSYLGDKMVQENMLESNKEIILSAKQNLQTYNQNYYPQNTTPIGYTKIKLEIVKKKYKTRPNIFQGRSFERDVQHI